MLLFVCGIIRGIEGWHLLQSTRPVWTNCIVVLYIDELPPPPPDDFSHDIPIYFFGRDGLYERGTSHHKYCKYSYYISYTTVGHQGMLDFDKNVMDRPRVAFCVGTMTHTMMDMVQASRLEVMLLDSLPLSTLDYNAQCVVYPVLMRYRDNRTTRGLCPVGEGAGEQSWSAVVGMREQHYVNRGQLHDITVTTVLSKVVRSHKRVNYGDKNNSMSVQPSRSADVIDKLLQNIPDVPALPVERALPVECALPVERALPVTRLDNTQPQVKRQARDIAYVCNFCLDAPGADDSRVIHKGQSAYLSLSHDPLTVNHCYIVPRLHSRPYMEYDGTVSKYMCTLLRHLDKVLFIINDIHSDTSHVRMECIGLTRTIRWHSKINKTVHNLMFEYGLEPVSDTLLNISIMQDVVYSGSTTDTVTLLIPTDLPRSDSDPFVMNAVRVSYSQYVDRKTGRGKLREFISRIRQMLATSLPPMTADDDELDRHVEDLRAVLIS